MDNVVVRAWFRSLLILMTFAVGGGAIVRAQAPASLDVFRIFLRDGRVLLTYGEPAQVEGDLVFVVTQGQKGGLETHDLITVPLAKVDVERTQEYANALRAAKYGATRGEREYQELTADIARSLAALEASDDKDRRLGIAQVARARLLAWSQDHFGYREADLRQLASLLDEIIVELQAAKGISQFSLNFVANVAPANTVPILSPPTPAETVASALAAASATDVGIEKMALLESASRVAASLPDISESVRADVARALAAERTVEAAYRALIRNAVTRADVAVRQGRPAVIRRLIRDVVAGDARLGHQRPRDTGQALRRLEGELVLAEQQRTALDRWTRVKDQLEAYEVRARSVLDGWVTQLPALLALRDRRRPNPAGMDAAVRRFSELDRALSALRPPDELRDVHSVLRSAVLMARQGLMLGQRLTVAANTDVARNASSAIVGAEMLRARGLVDLAAAVQPRRVR